MKLCPECDFIYEDDFAEDKDAYFERSMQVDEEGTRLVVNTDSNGRFHSARNHHYPGCCDSARRPCR